MKNILITTVPFGVQNSAPLDKLKKAGVNYVINPLGRKLREDDLMDMVGDFDVLIAGTEIISEKVLNCAKRLKLISRVGVGLDGVDLLAARQRGIQVSYTPDAPALAVADMTIGLMYSLLRSIHLVNSQMHEGEWHRHFGRRISEITVGIIGAGRIGGLVLQTLNRLGCSNILINDINDSVQLDSSLKYKLVNKDEIYAAADVVTLHLPLTKESLNMIRRDHLMKMKSDAMIINTSRGGIINEHDLASILSGGHLGGAAIDVFEQEPYVGELIRSPRCLLTSHMGSMSVDCRARMEIEATEEALRFISGLPLQGAVPAEEYELRKREWV
jgi:D-3-phosphoglycerate dehydrogenase